MIVIVTQKHINQGCRGIPTACPIAKAIGKGAWVEPEDVRVGSTLYYLPIEAQDFMVNFDKTGTGVPLEFEMQEV